MWDGPLRPESSRLKPAVRATHVATRASKRNTPCPSGVGVLGPPLGVRLERPHRRTRMRRAPCFLAAFAALTVLFIAPLGAQDPEAEKPEKVPAKNVQSEVIRLQHAAATEIVPVLSQSLPS